MERTLLQKLWSITLLLGMWSKKRMQCRNFVRLANPAKKWFALPGCMIKVSISGCHQQAAETTPIETNRALFNVHKGTNPVQKSICFAQLLFGAKSHCI